MMSISMYIHMLPKILKLTQNIKIYVELYPVHTLKYLYHKVFIYPFWSTLINI